MDACGTPSRATEFLTVRILGQGCDSGGHGYHVWQGELAGAVQGQWPGAPRPAVPPGGPLLEQHSFSGVVFIPGAGWEESGPLVVHTL